MKHVYIQPDGQLTTDRRRVSRVVMMCAFWEHSVEERTRPHPSVSLARAPEHAVQ